MDRTVDRTVIDRNTVPNWRKPYKIRWCTVIMVPYRITVNRTVHRRVTTLTDILLSHVVISGPKQTCFMLSLFGMIQSLYQEARKVMHINNIFCSNVTSGTKHVLCPLSGDGKHARSK
jgi:hypothetical protein